MSASSFSAALDDFKAASPWLSAQHEPEIVALSFLADELDAKPRSPAPLVAQWGLILRNLRKQAPTAAEEVDPVDDLIASARS